jgi:outer membrane protein assembly factor BamA
MFRLAWLSLVLSLLSSQLWAQADIPNGRFLRIDSIVVEGNAKTLDKIIIRELMFEQGSNYALHDFQELREKSEQNLMNTALFLSAEIHIHKQKNINIAYVNVVERWYLWPIPQVDIDERNFNVWWEHKRLDRLSAGVFLTKENFRGRMEKLTLLFMTGYNQQYGLSYEAPYINKSKTLGLGANIIWSGRHEVIAKTLDDKQVFFKDENNYVQEAFRTAVSIQYRKNFRTRHLLEFSYQKNSFSNGLLDSAQNYSWKGQQNLSFFNIFYKLKIDHRNFRPYPLSGYYADIEIFKHGLGILDNKGLDLWDVKTTLRKYWPLAEKWYTAVGFMGKISNYGSEPYLLQKSLGYGRDFVRGYEYYVIDGQHYAVGKSNLKYGLFQDKMLKLDFIKTRKFNTIPWAVYLNFFADAGYVSPNANNDVSNQLPGEFLYSVGLGLDFTTYYDRVARFEVARNHWGEVGFYLHFIAPI